MTGKHKRRIGLILEVKKSVHQGAIFLSRLFDVGDFPAITDKTELAFRNGHYYF